MTIARDDFTFRLVPTAASFAIVRIDNPSWKVAASATLRVCSRDRPTERALSHTDPQFV